MSAFLAMTAEAIRSGSERGSAIATPDQRLRVFVSSTLEELADERRAARDAIQAMRLTPVMFELGARPHAPQNLYRAYLDQSDVFVGIYWQRYGWVGPGMTISGLEEEYRLAGDKPRLLYLKAPAPAREERLAALIAQIESGADASYRIFTTAQELKELIAEDLAVLLTERFDYGVSARSVRMETSLPAAVDSFVGRVREQADLELALQDRSHRLVTITGPGGVGKTRLALEVARRARQAFADGAHYVPLAAISDSDLVLPTIRTSLRVNSSSRPAFEEVVDALHDADLLLVLDNFEQVLTAAPEVTRLLEACPRLSVLVTSRALLRLRGEREFRLAPLNRPAAAGERDDVEASDAGALFLERAQAANPSFTIDGTNRRVVAAICDRLDGLPLALELAAAQVRVLSPTSILQRVDQRLSLGVRPGAAVPDRHQTLRAAIDWSYALLTEAEKRQFRNAGVFRAGWTLDALEAVSAEPALDALASLTEQSLVVPQPVGVDVRFSMLPTIREYARELLDASPESDAIFDRHAEHYARVAAAANLNAGRITPGGVRRPGGRGAGQHPWRAGVVTQGRFDRPRPAHRGGPRTVLGESRSAGGDPLVRRTACGPARSVGAT